MSVRRKLATTAGAAALAFAGVLGTAGVASAGSNGQQIYFYDTLSNVYSIHLQGYNQNGDYWQLCVNTPQKETWVGGYWWKGNVEVSYYSNRDCPGNARAYKNYWVPTSQSGDWVTINSAGT
ncbi:hypothetical protein [Streptomyces lavendulocolor]|uniref:hypothetical protein n=1 Tax=Streptomyces lavendulocolor TaxID=67316 RepID=UPI003C2E9C20